MSEHEPQERIVGILKTELTRENNDSPFAYAAKRLSEKGIPLTPSTTRDLVFSAELQRLQYMHQGIGEPPEAFLLNLQEVDNPIWDEKTLPRVEATFFHNRSLHLQEVRNWEKETVQKLQTEKKLHQSQTIFFQNRMVEHGSQSHRCEERANELIREGYLLLTNEETYALVDNVIEKYFPEE